MIYACSLQIEMTLLADGGVDITPFMSRLDKLRDAINTHLWNESLGAYHISDKINNAFAQDINALAILAGVTRSNHTTQRVLQSLKQLFTPNGPLAFSTEATAAGYKSLISPYASGYHLRTALLAGDEQSAKILLKNLWKPMADPHHTNYKGCFWETLSPDGSPGLEDTTSLCHVWGSGPTGELSDYVVGVKPVKPGFKQWEIPKLLCLAWVRGKIPVPAGEISVAWKASNGGIVEMEVHSPTNISGTIKLPVEGSNSNDSPWHWERNGKEHSSTNTFTVLGGEKFVLNRKC